MTGGTRAAGAIAFAAGLLVLAAVYVVQFGLGIVPCELCLLERWPWRVLLALGLAALLVGGRTARAAAPLALVVLAASAALAFFHVGVEHGWWPSPFPSCRGGTFRGGPIADQFAAMPLRAAKPCDAPTYLVPGVPVSLVTLNLVVSLAAFAVMSRVTATVFRDRRRTA